MPCVSLGPQKTYKAKIIKPYDKLVNEAKPVADTDLAAISQATESLVNVATVAEEVLQSEQLLANPQITPITSKGVKAPSNHYIIAFRRTYCVQPRLRLYAAL